MRASSGTSPFVTNAYGFRDEPPLDPVPPEGEFRILSLGDSIGFGLGVTSEDRYAQVLQRELNDSPGAFRFRVVNASGQGYSPSSYAAYIYQEGLELNPDLVLVQIELCNDVTDEALLGWPSGVQASLPQSGPRRPIRGGLGRPAAGDLGSRTLFLRKDLYLHGPAS